LVGAQEGIFTAWLPSYMVYEEEVE
jgi:hypothetical protein